MGVLLMTFGTARTIDEIPAYLSSVRGGREVPPPLIEEFRRRFEVVGGSPLIEITLRQAAALEANLNQSGSPVSPKFVVRAGMRHSLPTIEQAFGELESAQVDSVIGLILSPQYSPTIMGGYIRAFEAAQSQLAFNGEVRVTGGWEGAPSFIDALAERVRGSLARRGTQRSAVIFTAHSLPRSVADGEPEYIASLHQTAESAAGRAGLDPSRWWFAYQSAGHTQEEWLKPDLVDVLPEIKSAGYEEVLVAPVQFLADHLEVLYDIDVAAAEQAATAGLILTRTESFNDSPDLIDALAWAVHREIAPRLARRLS